MIVSLLNILFMVLIIAGLLLFIYGFQKKSRLVLLLGGVATLTPLYYFVIGWNPFIVFVPPIALIISDLVIRKVEPN